MAREPARTPSQAEQRYVKVISRGLSCITRAIWVSSPPLRGHPEKDRVLYLGGAAGGGPVSLPCDMGTRVFLNATQGFRLIPDVRYEAGEWKATTLSYAYTIYERTEARDQVPVMAWHWHPGSGKSDEPHIHIYAPGRVGERDWTKLHIPSERVAFESVVRFLIEELGVTPLRDDWSVLIEEALAMFVRFRTWPRSSPVETD